MKRVLSFIMGAILACSIGTTFAFAEEVSSDTVFDGAIISDAPYTEYSSDELNEIAAEIEKQTENQEWIRAIKVGEEKKCVYIFVNESSETEDLEAIKALAKTCEEKYGVNAVVFSGGDPNATSPDEDIIAEGTLETPILQSDRPNMWVYASLICGIIIVIGAAVIVLRSRKAHAYQTANGDVISANKHIGKNEVVNTIQSSTYQPSNELLGEITERINKNSE